MKMDETHAFVRLAGIDFFCEFKYPGTAERFKQFCVTSDTVNNVLPVVKMQPDEIELMKEDYPRRYLGDFSEFNALVYTFTEALLPYNCFCFHGAVFLWRGKAVLFTAPSGTGKTTQYLNWKQLYGDEIEVICGDKPVLKFEEDGSVWVHPSPWTGKEGYGGCASAQLAAIIFLEQGRTNKLRRMEIKEAVCPIMNEVLTLFPNEKSCRKIAELEEKLLDRIPIYKLINTGDLESARITHKQLLKEI